MSCNFINHLLIFILLLCIWTPTWIIAILSKHWRKEASTYSLIVIIKTFKNEESWYCNKYFCISVVHLRLKFVILFTCCLNDRGKMNKLFTFFCWYKIGFSFFPKCFKVYQSIDKILIVFQLWINTLNIFFIFSKQRSQSSKTFPNALCQLPNSLGLLTRYPSTNSFSLEKNISLKIISSFSIRICNSIYLVNDFN